MFNSMTTPNTLIIHKLIAEAKEQDAKSGALLTFVQSKTSELHNIIQLPSSQPEQALKQFITQYIEHAPLFLEALNDLMLEANIYDQGGVFITIAEDFFISPPVLVKEHSGLVALLDEAYLAHRIIEEINDRVSLKCGTPLCPTDMSISNIIVHTLLGDEFANQLDLAVHYSIEHLFKEDGIICSPHCSQYLQEHKDNQWAEVLTKWPSLSGDTSIDLNIKSWLL